MGALLSWAAAGCKYKYGAQSINTEITSLTVVLFSHYQTARRSCQNRERERSAPERGRKCAPYIEFMMLLMNILLSNYGISLNSSCARHMKKWTSESLSMTRVSRKGKLTRRMSHCRWTSLNVTHFKNIIRPFLQNAKKKKRKTPWSQPFNGKLFFTNSDQRGTQKVNLRHLLKRAFYYKGSDIARVVEQLGNKEKYHKQIKLHQQRNRFCSRKEHCM